MLKIIKAAQIRASCATCDWKDVYNFVSDSPHSAFRTVQIGNKAIEHAESTGHKVRIKTKSIKILERK